MGKLPGHNSENHDGRGEGGQSGGKRGEKEKPLELNCLSEPMQLTIGSL